VDDIIQFNSEPCSFPTSGVSSHASLSFSYDVSRVVLLFLAASNILNLVV